MRKKLQENGKEHNFHQSGSLNKTHSALSTVAACLYVRGCNKSED